MACDWFNKQELSIFEPGRPFFWFLYVKLKKKPQGRLFFSMPKNSKVILCHHPWTHTLAVPPPCCHEKRSNLDAKTTRKTWFYPPFFFNLQWVDRHKKGERQTGVYKDASVLNSDVKFEPLNPGKEPIKSRLVNHTTTSEKSSVLLCVEWNEMKCV